MPKATLRFDLNDVDERIAFKVALAGSKYLVALQDIRQTLRDKAKHGEEPAPKSWHDVQDLFFDIINDLGVNLDAED